MIILKMMPLHFWIVFNDKKQQSQQITELLEEI